MRWILMLLIGCGGARATSGVVDDSVFHLSYPDASVAAKVGKRFYAKPVAQCTYDNGREAHWAITGARVETGELPPGITIEDGAITGSPTKAGEYAVRLLVTGIACAGKSYPDERIDVKLVVR